MIVRYREEKAYRDTVLDFSESSFSTDELLKQIAQRLRDNQRIYSLSLEGFDLYEKGANALRHSILGHKSLRNLALVNMRICSYPVTTDDEYYFPKDLDLAVDQLCAILRDGRLKHIQLKELDFFDRTEHHYEHFDMVDPATMRDLLLQEKAPFYIKEILYSLNHNPHLLKLQFSTVDVEVVQEVKKIEENIKKRHNAEHLNEFLQGTHAAVETQLVPEIFKFVTAWSWMQSKFKKNK